jgi:hypothetical protein
LQEEACVTFRTDPASDPNAVRAADEAFDLASVAVHDARIFRRGTGDEVMEERSHIFIFSPDGANRDPFRPFRTWKEDTFPPGHSRFPLLPAEQYGDLSFETALGENADPEERKVVPTLEQRVAWRDAMTQALGDLVEVPPVHRRED